MENLQTLLAFIIALGLLVSFHEFGHFWVARRCGVKVLRFSVGFGKALYTWRDKLGTEYVIALIPLGGYVKMLDEREGEVPPELQHEAFNNKPVWQRMLIVAAGPLANFLLAIVVLWGMYVLGVSTVVPVIGDVRQESPAWQAGVEPGEEVVAINGEKTASWYAVNLALLRPLGETGNIQLQVRPHDNPDAAVTTYDVPVSNWLTGEEQPDPVSRFGLEPWRPIIPAVIGEVLPDGAAAAAGLQSGDRIVAVNGEPVADWVQWVEQVRSAPLKSLQVAIERQNLPLVLEMTPGEKDLGDGRVIGFIGAGAEPWQMPPDMIRNMQYGPLAAFGPALRDTVSLTTLTLDSIKKMIEGLVSVKNLSGPITIAKVAGASFKSGLESFLNFLAMLSISLGVLNLLPVPVLDGGHLLYYLVELVRGKPLSEQAQMIGLRIGIAAIVSLMLLALYNDLARL
ncbi:sigma E protease regulator RseP [Spongorhabdus nitratireducens]